MAHQAGAQRSAGSGRTQGAALTVVRITVGLYLFFLGIAKVRWLIDSTPLATQLAAWSAQASPISLWYLERLTPGTPVFARLIPLGEMVGGLALVVGFWTRLVAAAMFLVILNSQIVSGAIFGSAYLTNARGLPLLGSLAALMLGGGRLPFSLKR